MNPEIKRSLLLAIVMGLIAGGLVMGLHRGGVLAAPEKAFAGMASPDVATRTLGEVWQYLIVFVSSRRRRLHDFDHYATWPARCVRGGSVARAGGSDLGALALPRSVSAASRNSRSSIRFSISNRLLQTNRNGSTT